MFALEDENGNTYEVVYKPEHSGGFAKFGWITGRGDGYRFKLMKWTSDSTIKPPQTDGYYTPSPWILDGCRKGITVTTKEPALVMKGRVDHSWIGAGYNNDDVLKVEDINARMPTNFMLTYSVYQSSHVGRMLVGIMPGIENTHRLNVSGLDEAVKSKRVMNYILTHDGNQVVQSLIQKGNSKYGDVLLSRKSSF